RAYQALSGSGPSGFSAKVTYIYKMQQNEADVVAINKIDTLDREGLEELTALVQRNFPKAEVIGVSARSGAGFDRLAELLEAAGPVGGRAAKVDYDTYAEGEARLGWLNARVRLAAERDFEADELALAVPAALRDRLAAVGAEPAHVKVLLESGEAVAIANVVGNDRAAELSRRSGSRITDGEMIINARVETDPAVLRQQVEDALQTVGTRHDAVLEVVAMDALSPPPPVPTHRPGEVLL
ncbi:MAG: GTP-binding protein, partial [Planctomycetota bacterium]